jgi:gluconolactonase
VFLGVVLFFAFSVTAAVGDELPPPTGDPSILPPGAKLELLFDKAIFTEGPAVAPDNCVYFSDITFTFASDMQAGHIWKYDPKTGETTIFRSPSGMSNGLKFDAEGNLIAALGADYGGRMLVKTDMKTGKSYILTGLYNGRPYNALNDVTIDEKGRIYFSDPRYLGHEPIDQPIMGVYRYDPDKSVHLIITDAGKPNGVCVSPDQKTLYVVSNDNGCWANERIPEGPEGKELAYIPTPIPTNVAFGRGEYSKTLYVTAGHMLYKIQMMKDGYLLPQK